MRLGKTLVAAAVAGALAVVAPAIAATPVQAAGITECGTYDIGHHGWTYHTISGAVPVANLTTRNVPCYLARPFSLYVTRTGNYHYHGFRFRVRESYETYDIRATKGDQVIHWQGGA